MQLAPPRILEFTDPASGLILFSAPMPSLAQIEACIRLDLPTPEASEKENPIARHRRYVLQLLALVTPAAPIFWVAPIAWWRWSCEKRRRARWMRDLQYHQLLDLYRKLMLSVQGFDFDTLEEFERASMAQKKSTPTSQPNPETPSSSDSTSSASASQ